MKRTIVKIDENLCNGCGNCVIGCHEGALKIIDGKARIVHDIYCDGLGACIGTCPEGAISLEEREAQPFNEVLVLERMTSMQNEPCGCTGARELSFSPKNIQNEVNTDVKNNTCVNSQLRQWPVQLHLLNPQANFLKKADLVLAADCAAFAYGDFHNRFIKNNHIAIACPKLDHSKEIYVEKLIEMIDNSLINTLTVIIMEVPCCGGLLYIAQQAQTNANRKIPVKKVVIEIQGNIISEEWI